MSKKNNQKYSKPIAKEQPKAVPENQQKPPVMDIINKIRRSKIK